MFLIVSIIVALIIGLIVGFVIGMLVYRKNSKVLEPTISQGEKLVNDIKDKVK